MAVTVASVEVPASLPFAASLVDPPGVETLGARVEIPVTRAIATAFAAATLQAGVWTVTLDAPDTPGAYELVWRDNDGLGPGGDPLFEAFVPLVVVAGTVTGPVPLVEYPEIDEGEIRPSVDEVAQLERTRTVEAGGNEAGTFTANTRPTSDECDQVIDQALDDIVVQLPVSTINPKHYRQVRRAITLQAAILIEGSYYREQANDHAVAIWETLRDRTVAGLVSNIESDLAQQNLIGRLEPADPSAPTRLV